MLSILHRYVLWELIRSFVLSFAALVGVMLVGAVYKPLRHGISLGDLASFLPYVLPLLYAWVIPAAMLSACVMSYGRLSADNELKAICASGIPLRYACYPALLLAIALTCIAIPLNDWLIPYCDLLKDRELRAIFLKEPFRVSMLGGQITIKIGGYKIYVESVQGNRLHNVIVIEPKDADRAGAGKKEKKDAAKEATGRKARREAPSDETAEVNVYRAQQADYSIDKDGRRIRIVLRQAQCNIVMPDRRATGWFELTADEQVKDIPTTEGDASFLRRSNQTTEQLLLLARERRRDLAAGKQPRKMIEGDLTRVLTEVRVREALAFATIALCLAGVPLGIWMRRQNRLASFGVAVVVFLTLYAMLVGGEGLALDGQLPPRVALWTPDILTGSLGVGMLLHQFRR